MELKSVARELVALLESIASGETIVWTEQDPQVVFTGEVAFGTDTGWRLLMDVDCNSYGGFVELVTPEGRRWGRTDLEAIDAEVDGLFAAHPEVEWEGFGLGGYHDTRCRQCGASRLGEGSLERFCGVGACRSLREPPCPSRLRLSTRDP